MPYGGDPRWRWKEQTHGNLEREAQPAMAVMGPELHGGMTQTDKPPSRCPRLSIPAGWRKTPVKITQAGASLYRVMKERVEGVLEWMRHTVGAYRQITQRWQARQKPAQQPTVSKAHPPSPTQNTGTCRPELTREERSPDVRGTAEVASANCLDHTTSRRANTMGVTTSHMHLPSPSSKPR